MDTGLENLILERVKNGGLEALFPSSALTNLYFSNKLSETLSLEDIKKSLEVIGFFPSLIQYHIADYIDIRQDEFLKILAELPYIKDPELQIKEVFKPSEFVKYLPNVKLITFIHTILTFNRVELVEYIKPACLELASRESFFTVIRNCINSLLEFEKRNPQLELDYYNFIEEFVKVWEQSGVSEIRNQDLLWFVNERLGIKYEICQRMDDQGPYIIAFKGVTADGHSVFSDRVTYKVGEEYDAVCDRAADSENSYGLSVWDYARAKAWGDKVLRVKVYLKDIKYISISEGKIRASKIFIINEV